MYPFIDPIVFDRLGIMEYLLYGFELGERTLIQGVSRLPPASVIFHQHAPLSLSIEQVLSFSFEPDRKNAIERTSQDIILVLKTAFISGLQNRVERLRTKTPLILLSGGLDSRATLAGLTACDVHPKGITYDASKADKSEVEYTKKIADLFETPLTYLAPLSEVDTDDYLRIVMLFDAALPMDIAHVLKLEEQISQREGSDGVVYTGLYGGEMFRYLNITSGLSSDDDLVKFLLTTPDKYRFDTEKVCAMLRISEEDMRQHLQNHISTYPEKDPYSKYCRFKFEKDFRLAIPGEDKFRLLNWTVTPFYSKEFFETAYKIDEGKKGTLFFRNFLYALDPKTCSVDYYNYRMNLSSPLRLHMLEIAERAVRHPHIRRLTWWAIDLKTRHALPDEPDPQIEHLKMKALELLEKSQHLKEYLFDGATRDIISSEANADKLQRILTLIIYMGSLEQTTR
jgi:asparagine synthase (glutamine-hydrolysing)